jgi:hypothetical protein
MDILESEEAQANINPNSCGAQEIEFTGKLNFTPKT